ncbi:MAG: sensor histidine kinase [Acidimicrobiales bacterium]
MRRNVIGTVAALVTMGALSALMIPFRNHLSIATTALVLVVPVVIGVVAGGFVAGVISVAAGFLVYDFFFIPPYLTLWIGDPQNWVALGVYAAVMLPVSKVVAAMNSAKAEARRQGRDIRELFELSHLLVEDKPLDLLLSAVVATVAEVFTAPQVALLLPDAGRLNIVAAAGRPLSEAQLRRVLPPAGELTALDARPFERDGLLVVALAAAGRPVGLLVLTSESAAQRRREPLLLFANQIALAVERVQLRDQAVQTRLAEAMGRLAKTLVGAVAHDLRAPLASIKASSSTLADAELKLSSETSHRLAQLIDVQTDRLSELVRNLLDMSRIQAGVLQPRLTVASVADLVSTVIDDLSPRGHVIRAEIADGLPPVDVDLALISRALTNLLENALRHSPKSMPITVSAAHADPYSIKVSVTDHGPGISAERRDDFFELYARRSDDTGAGLGLTIAKTFIEAHGQRIWLDDTPGGGATFSCTLPVAVLAPEERKLASNPHH